MVDAMVKRGIFIREAAQDDRRKVMIRISENGRRLAWEYECFFNDVCREFAAGVSREEMENFIGILDKLNTFLYNKQKEQEL